ncbi:MAG: hypothetical protein SOI44_02750 [Lactimicrobium sp.]|jgi:hypothetical protein|uniref:hypothetical protein n=1 Tax=Lactimicrobium sp. TaxID=2563780 RepID=UPI002F35245D
MAKLSRTEKYKDLRESLQNDVGQDIATKDLHRFQDRLNQIDSNNFAPPSDVPDTANDHDPIHVRRAAYQSPRADESSVQRQPDPQDSLNFEHDDAQDEEPAFANDYLDRYINEVKQYNIAQGNAVSENTEVNILDRLKKEQPEPAPDRPYRERETSRNARRTTQVPFINQNVTPNAYRAEDDDTPSAPDNARDIASTVRGLVDDDTPSPKQPARTKAASYQQQEQVNTDEVPDLDQDGHHVMSTGEFNRRMELERTTRQQLLNETTQMRAQLDDYEDNLSEVSDKMRHTNQILNIVLVVLIIALIIVLLIVIYWIFLSRKGA